MIYQTPHLQKQFKIFYDSLINKENIIYMFFTSEMLFWVFKSFSFIHQNTNLVLIASCLDNEEKVYLRGICKNPIFFTDEYYDDKDIWEILFAINRYNFGWMDCDCLIFNSSLFQEITQSIDGYSMNCIWASPDSLNTDRYYINTYFLFINISVIRKVEAIGLHVSPRVYVYENPEQIHFTKSLIVEKKHLPYIEKIIKPGYYPSPSVYKKQENTEKYFDTLRLFQIIAESVGYPLQRIRCLDNVSSYYSDEAIHIGGSANFSVPYIQTKLNYIADYKFNLNLYRFISYFFLKQTKHMLPKKYEILYRQLSLKLQKENIKEDDMIYSIYQFIADNQLNIETAKRILTFDL